MDDVKLRGRLKTVWKEAFDKDILRSLKFSKKDCIM